MNIFRLNDINCVLEARLNILHCKIGVIIPNNGFKRNRFPHQFENRLNGDACPGNTRFSKMNFGADLNAIHAGNISLSRHKRQAAIGVHLDRGINPGTPVPTTELKRTLAVMSSRICRIASSGRGEISKFSWIWRRLVAVVK